MNIERMKKECWHVYEACVNRLDGMENVEQRIAEFTPFQSMRQYCAWHLGDAVWANAIIESYEQLKKIEAGEL